VPSTSWRGVQREETGTHRGHRPAVEFDLYEDDLREIENIMQGAVMVGGPSSEGV
jgi:hypothetical protein